MTLQELLANPPLIHQTAAGDFADMSLGKDALAFIDGNVNNDSATLETGCGASTVLFGIKGSRHFVMTPAQGEFDFLQEYCRERQIPTEKITFFSDASERVLPRLETPPLDLALIDGRHGFPAPFIDWFYIAGKLRLNGFLIVDDTTLWTGAVLKNFMLEQPEWELVVDFAPRTSIFRKIGEGSEWGDWTDQPFVERQGMIRFVNGNVKFIDPSIPPTSTGRVIAHIRHGEFAMLGKKLVRRLTR